MAKTRTTEIIEALAGLPNWPLMLSAVQAAAYVGLDAELFDLAVGAGEIPKPALLQGRSLWNRQRLDRHLDDPTTPAIGAFDEIADALERWSPK